MGAVLTGCAAAQLLPECERPIDVRSDAGTTRLCEAEPIRDAESHRAALARVDAMLTADPDIQPGTPAGDELDALIDRIEQYEEQAHGG